MFAKNLLDGHTADGVIIGKPGDETVFIVIRRTPGRNVLPPQLLPETEGVCFSISERRGACDTLTVIFEPHVGEEVWAEVIQHIAERCAEAWEIDAEDVVLSTREHILALA